MNDKEVKKLEKERIKKTLRILTLNVDDLPKKKRHLYILIYILFFTIQSMVIFYMVFFLSRKRPYFGILGLVYLLALLALVLIINREIEGRVQ